MFKLAIYCTTLFGILFQTYLLIQIDETFRELFVVPDVIDVPPAKPCNVTFSIKNETLVLRPGQLIPERFHPVKPEVSWPAPALRTFYTLYMVGITKWFLEIDRRGMENLTGTTVYPFGYEWHCWIVVNIPGNNVEEGETLYPWIPPVNPAKEEIHDRYIILVYEQGHEKKKFDPPVDGLSYKFSELSTVRDFAKHYNLGVPKYGNVFLSKWVDGPTTSYSEKLFFGDESRYRH